MDEAKIDALVKAYIQFEYATAKTEGQYFWAWDRLNEYIYDKPEIAWIILKKIVTADSSTQMLADLSAGPMEYFLVHHGPEFIDRVEEEARDNPIFAKLLGGVWKNVINEDIWKRIQKVCDKSWIV
jgi:hypothetical protein